MSTGNASGAAMRATERLVLPNVSGTVGGVDRAARSVRVVAASAEAIWTDGQKVTTWDLERFGKNPVILWNHDDQALPIGTARDVVVQPDNALTMTVVFASATANPEAEQIFQGIAEGVLRGVSVGFDWSKTAPGVAMLVEVSVVPIPKDEDALIVTDWTQPNVDARTRARLDAVALFANAPESGAAWREGACTCACAVARGSDGLLQKNASACTCSRVAGVHVDQYGDPKLVIENCAPEDPDMTKRTDSDAADTMATVIAKRDRAMADAWKTTDADRLDARTHAKRKLRALLDEGCDEEDEECDDEDFRALRAFIGDSSIATATPAFVRRALAHVRRERSAAAPATNTDGSDDPVTAARARRDAAMVNAWRTAT